MIVPHDCCSFPWTDCQTLVTVVAEVEVVQITSTWSHILIWKKAKTIFVISTMGVHIIIFVVLRQTSTLGKHEIVFKPKSICNQFCRTSNPSGKFEFIKISSLTIYRCFLFFFIALWLILEIDLFIIVIIFCVFLFAFIFIF